MPGTEYEVNAKLVLDATRARRDLLRAQRDILKLDKQIDHLGLASKKSFDKLGRGAKAAHPEVMRTSGAVGGLMRNLLGMGAAYVAVRAVVGGIKAMADGALAYNVELERTKIGLTSIFQALSGGQQSWAQAAAVSDKVFNDLQSDAIKSVATTQELFGVYQSIVGPIMAAGAGMDVVRKMTNDTVAAASVLNVDLPQAQRDIGQIVRGTAGADVKLFSILKSTGAITENAEQWNKNLSAGQRIAKLQTALAKFAPAGERFGKSWAGVTSTFKDIRQQFTQSAMKPVIDSMGTALDRVNSYFITNQDRIRSKLAEWGESFAKKIDSAFERASKAAAWTAKNWDGVAERMRLAVSHAGKIALAGTALAVGKNAVGGVISTLGSGGGGGAAAGATGAAAAVGGIAAGTAAVVLLGVAVAGVAHHVDIWREALKPTAYFLSGFAGDLIKFGKQAWDTIGPLVTLLSTGLIPVFALIVGAARKMVQAFTWVLKKMQDVAEWVFGPEKQKRVTTANKDFWNLVVGSFGDEAADAAKVAARASEAALEARIRGWNSNAGGASSPVGGYSSYDPSMFDKQFMSLPREAKGAPKDRSQINVDMRGSKISVKQEFRQADPDRVLIDMVHALSRQAEMRIQSGYVPALGRG